MSTQAPITTAQLKILQAEFSRLKKEDDPRTCGPGGEVFTDDRDGRIAWAQSHLGLHRLDTFNALTVLQAEYLIDTLKKGHNKTKIDGFILKEFQRMGVENAADYFLMMQSQNAKWKFNGRPLANLNRQQKCALAQMLSTRGVSPARGTPSKRSVPHASAYSTSPEQRMLWGVK